MSVIVADRNRSVAELLQRIVLETTGRAAYALSPSEDLVEAVSAGSDLVLLLVEAEPYMPERLSAVRQLRAMKPELPVAIASFSDGARLAEELGCPEWLEKPFDLEAVQALLRKYLGS